MNERLSLTDIGKRYEDAEALVGASLHLHPGEILGVIGENGSGKSTLLRVIAGLTEPDGGEMHVEGAPYRPRTPADAARAGICTVLDTPSLAENLTVAENVLHGHYAKRFGVIDWHATYRQCGEIFARLGVPIDPRAQARALSIREKRLVELLHAINARASIVLFDEPDLSREDLCFEPMLRAFQALKAYGGSLILTTHRIETMLDIADRVLILESGRVVCDRPADSLSSDAVLRLMRDPMRDLYPKLCTSADKPLLRLGGVSTGEGLDHLDMTIHRREILGVTALSERLRAALPRAIYGLTPLTGGEITLMGQKIEPHDPADAVKLGIGYLSEYRLRDGLVPEAPLPPNITLSRLRALRMHGMLLGRKREYAAARTYVRAFNIRMASLYQPARTLSAGNQQKLLLARWLYSDCRLLILEEPTKNIDNASKNEIYNFMNAFVQRGGSLLLVSSHIDELIGMCDRVIALRGSASQIFTGAQATRESVYSFLANRPMSNTDNITPD